MKRLFGFLAPYGAYAGKKFLGFLGILGLIVVVALIAGLCFALFLLFVALIPLFFERIILALGGNELITVAVTICWYLSLYQCFGQHIFGSDRRREFYIPL